MSTMNISLPETLKSLSIRKLPTAYGSSEDMRELLRKEQDRVRLRRLILDGMESELIDEPMDSRYFDKLRKRIAEKQK